MFYSSQNISLSPPWSGLFIGILERYFFFFYIPFLIFHCQCKEMQAGFPGGAVVENLPANAGDTGSSPGLGRSHMLRSNQAHHMPRSNQPQLLSLCNWSLCSATREAAIVRGPRTTMKSGPRSPQLEKAHAQKRRPDPAKNK